MNRRQFLMTSTFVAGAAAARDLLAADEPPKPAERFTAAVIGHTGAGDYGHGLDVIFAGRDDIEVVAVADPDEGGRAAAAGRAGAKRQYGDYRQMLEKERPQLVAVGPRWTDEHHAMAMAAVTAGAHVITEKPFMQTPAEADEVLALAAKTKRKIATAHQFRLAPSVQHLKRRIEQDKLIGDLLHLNAWGKQDGRAGGEDMMVLGTHVFDLMRLFAGDPLWCSARVLQQGRDITVADAHPTRDRVGPVAGDEVYAQFAFANGVNGSFNSRGRMRQQAGVWGIELVGSTGSARLVLSHIHPPVHLKKPEPWSADGRGDAWKRMGDDPSQGLDDEARGFGPANRRVLEDWLEAIKTDREPACSADNAAKAIEMVYGVYHAGLTGVRVHFPLKDRGHPLKA